MGTLRLGALGASMLSSSSCTMRPSRPARSYSRGSTIVSRISARSSSDTSMTRHSRRRSATASTYRVRMETALRQVTSWSTPAGIQMARCGGTMKLAVSVTTAITPDAA
jgi:hypothetical protein